MEIVLLLIVVASITSIFVFKSDKSFFLSIYDSLEQKTARSVPSRAVRIKKAKALSDEIKEVFFIFLFIFLYIGSFELLLYGIGIPDKSCIYLYYII